MLRRGTRFLWFLGNIKLLVYLVCTQKAFIIFIYEGYIEAGILKS